MIDNERIAYLSRVAAEYYDRGRAEPELAADLGVPIEQVAQLLAEAREAGVVEVKVREPWATSAELEQALVATFRLKSARVLVRQNRSAEEALQGLGLLAAQLFKDLVRPTSIIGISWGTALYQMIKAMPPGSLPNAEVVQLIGATGSEDNSTDGPVLARLLANRLGCRARYLHAPLIVDSEVGREALLQERSIRETLRQAEQADIALVGIGSTDSRLYSLLRAGYVDEAQAERLRDAGAIGDICAQHYAVTGEWLDIDWNRRAVGISLHALSKIPTVVGVAGGAAKAATILGALRGQYINVLITDDEAARAVLALHQQQPAGQSVPAAVATSTTPLVSLKGIWKVFDGVAVLRGVDLDVKSGEIHALLGGNGSGKSTLMKILSGVHLPEAGAIELEGEPVTIANPAQAHELGIYLVPQEPRVFTHLSVEENLLIGSGLRAAAARERIQQLAAALGFEGDLSEAAGTLSIANQQLLEIMRGLLRQAKVLIFDEPTSTLTFREVDSLFERMRMLASQGIGLFFISHRLTEVLNISQRISVLRDGALVLTAPTATLTSRDLVRAMLPETAVETKRSNGHSERQTANPGKPLLEIRNLSGDAFQKINLTVRAGEVVGLAGLVGAGRTELAHAVLGIDPHTQGEVMIDGRPAVRRNPRRCQELGLVYLPEDRHVHGIFLDLPNMHTTTAGILRQLGRWLISARLEREIANRYVGQLQIKISGLGQLAKTLSGGNQQKVVLAKCLAGQPKVVILDEPTRGVDAKARLDLYQLIQLLTAQGVGVLLISSDLEEVIQLSDRVLVMFHGAIMEELPRAQCQIERITAASFGLRGDV